MSPRESRCRENINEDSDCGGIKNAFLSSRSLAEESRVLAEVEEVTAQKYLDLGKEEEYKKHIDQAKGFREEQERHDQAKEGFKFFLKTLDECKEDWETIEALTNRIMNGESPLACILKDPKLKTCRLKPIRADECYDSEELRKGMLIESEHTDDPELQKIITKHHLEEFPQGYTDGLMELEDRLKREGTR